ncbi:MAG: hypothetical protein JST44_00425 [Cyanobacteria bacterium SZAS LIN-5]|nr:hypothetical protein [Cyanobacteria bacterium SZAS LIN-5]
MDNKLDNNLATSLDINPYDRLNINMDINLDINLDIDWDSETKTPF